MVENKCCREIRTGNSNFIKWECKWVCLVVIPQDPTQDVQKANSFVVPTGIKEKEILEHGENQVKYKILFTANTKT